MRVMSQHKIIIKGIDSEVRLPRFESQPYLLLSSTYYLL